MIVFIRVLRIFLAAVAIWQGVGLLPVLTDWLPNLAAVTGGMWAIVFLKVLALVLCAGAFYALGRVKRRIAVKPEKHSDFVLAGLAILVLVVVAIAVAVVMGPSERGNAAQAPTQAAASQVAPTYTSTGWTEESTGSTEAGPWLDSDPAGTRYYRNAVGIIYRIYPPGMKPDAKKANRFGVGTSMSRNELFANRRQP